MGVLSNNLFYGQLECRTNEFGTVIVSLFLGIIDGTLSTLVGLGAIVRASFLVAVQRTLVVQATALLSGTHVLKATESASRDNATLGGFNTYIGTVGSRINTVVI